MQPEITDRWNTKQVKAYWYGVLALAFFIPVSQLTTSVILIVLILWSLFLKKKPRTEVFQQGWDSWLFVLVLLAGLTYTDDIDTGLKTLETSLSLIVLPLIFISIPGLGKKQLHELFFSFCAGLTLAFLVCMVTAGIRYSVSGNWMEFYGDNLTSALDNTHPIYFAYYLIFMITFGLYLKYYEENLKINRFASPVMLIFSFAALMLLGSSTAIVGILFSVLYFVLKFIYEEKRTRSKYFVFFLSLIFLVCLFWINNLGGPDGSRPDEYWERFVLWESAMKALPNWIIGVGTGDYTSVLNQFYVSHNLSQFAAANYNAHNQFIEVLFEVGVPGLFALLLMICRPIYFAVQSQNIFGFLSIFPFIIYGMTEVFLGRYQGVIFFALLHQAFISFYIDYRAQVSLKVGKI